MRPYSGLEYQKLNILASSPLEIVARACELAADACERARCACAENDIAAKGASVKVCAAAITLLKSHLDIERGGEVAVNLDRAYAHLLARLLHAHSANDLAVFDDVTKHLQGLRSAWEEAARRSRESEGKTAQGVEETEVPSVDVTR